jgi:hypothetical protein
LLQKEINPPPTIFACLEYKTYTITLHMDIDTPKSILSTDRFESMGPLEESAWPDSE